MAKLTEKRMDEIIGRLLRAGVILSAVFVIAGGAIYLARHPGPVPDYLVFRGEPEELRTVPGIIHEALALRGRGLIQFGLLILIATPMGRVAFSAVAFLNQRDWTYVVVTLIVLGLLVYSLSGGGRGGSVKYTEKQKGSGDLPAQTGSTTTVV